MSFTLFKTQRQARLTGRAGVAAGGLSSAPFWRLSGWQLNWRGLFFSLAAVGFSTALFFSTGLAARNVNMIYLLLTLFATVWFGLGTGLLTALVAFLCFDFFFIVPYFTFEGEIQDELTIFLFLATALFTNQISGRARLHSQQAQARSKEITALYELVSVAITSLGRPQFLPAVLENVSQALNARQCRLFLQAEADTDTNRSWPRSDGHRAHYTLQEAASSPNLFGGSLTQLELPIEQEKLATVFETNQPVFAWLKQETAPDYSAKDRRLRLLSKTAQSLPVAAYLPLRSARQKLGVLVVLLDRPQPRPGLFKKAAMSSQVVLSQAEEKLLEIFASHLALLIEHTRLVEENAQVAALRDSDRLKSALLASVSHELRTPLTAIKTATNSLLNPRTRWTEESRNEFLGMIEQEVNRLTNLVSNLLDLSRLEGGALKPDFGWYFLPEIVESVVERLSHNRLVRTHPLLTCFDPGIPLTRMDYLQIDQTLTNLIENAAKYSPAGQPITIEVEIVKTAELTARNPRVSLTTPTGGSEPGWLLVSVRDQGIGISREEQPLIFEKFYRGSNITRIGTPVHGTGIGLTLAKGLVEAHGGFIWVESPVSSAPAEFEETDNTESKGSIFYFSLPLVKLAESFQAEE